MIKEPDVPDVLYRGFEHLEHASAFIDEGVIRFGWLQRYREIEDAGRRDIDEGTAAFRAPDAEAENAILEQWARGLNWIYIFSCSTDEHAASEFGHVVRINSPEGLI